ncbi:hypothetical protein [Micromonospora sp. NPDC049102]|uniref:hypothetical protein n=1 Tax=Micromonospora sp. NPDC049102 TaxID=3364265 RepID=UPI00371951FF
MDVDGVRCLEFATTWVPSGVFVGPAGLSVPPEVLLAEPIPGLHALHLAPAADWFTQGWSSVLGRVLSTQPLDVLARTVDAPPASVVAALDLAGVIARADALQLPVHVSGNAPARSGVDLRVLPFTASGRPAEAGGAAYSIVLPESHLVARHTSTTGFDRTMVSRPMPDLLRLSGERVEVGLPQPIANRRFAGSVLTATRTGETRSVAGGVHGLWRALATLESGSAVRIHATTAEGVEVFVAIRSPEGLAVLRDSADAQAADLPRTPVALSVTPVSLLTVAPNDPVIRPQGAAAALGGAVGVSARLARAVSRLPAWTDNTPDCAARVDAVLRDYGLLTVREDISPPIDDIAGRLRGRFQPSALQRLVELAPGALTVVRVDHPNQRPHLVVIERQRNAAFTVVETQPRDGRVLTSFTLDNPPPHPHPEFLGGPIALPIGPDGRLCQANENGLLSGGPAATTTHTAAAVLADPSTGSAGMPPRARREVVAASSTTPLPPSHSEAPGLTVDAIKRAYESLGWTWRPKDPIRLPEERFLRAQLASDGGWSDSWPIGIYIEYVVTEWSKSRTVPQTLNPAITRALIDIKEAGWQYPWGAQFVYLLRGDMNRLSQLRKNAWQVAVVSEPVRVR